MLSPAARQAAGDIAPLAVMVAAPDIPGCMIALMRLAQAILFVNDLARMKGFYGAQLGLSVIEEADGYVRLDAGGSALMLHAIREPPSPVPRQDSFLKLAFH